MNERQSTVSRKTRETDIEVTLQLDGSGNANVSSGLGFLDHMLTTLARHGRLDLQVQCEGDLVIDDHHTVEDIAITLGSALREAAGELRGIRRFGSAYAPLDESLARCVVDFCGRAHAEIDLGLTRDSIGQVACENLDHFFRSLASAARITLHVDVLKGRNDHHRAEAAFKATALALRQALTLDASQDVPSTKGVLG